MGEILGRHEWVQCQWSQGSRTQTDQREYGSTAMHSSVLLKYKELQALSSSQENKVDSAQDRFRNAAVRQHKAGAHQCNTTGQETCTNTDISAICNATSHPSHAADRLTLRVLC